MPMRFGLGPVFTYEWLARTRRWQGYALRVLVVLILFSAMALVWTSWMPDDGSTLLISQMAQVGQTFYATTICCLLLLLGLSAPAATAGAICTDKARGNLALVFATDLSSAEVILGKLATRLIPVLGTIACIVPILAITTSFGGIDPEFLFGAFLVVLTCAVFGCCLALALSVWGRKTHEVLMGTYAFGILYLLAAPIWLGIRGLDSVAWTLLRFNPAILVLVPMEPTFRSTIGFGGYWAFAGLGLGMSVSLVLLSIWSVRRVAIAHLSQGVKREKGLVRFAGVMMRGLAKIPRLVMKAWGFLPVPTLDRNPVLWRELHRKAPSRWSMAIWGAYILIVGGFSILVIGSFVQPFEPLLSFPSWGGNVAMNLNILQVFTAFLLLSVTSATSLAEERQRGSLDVLLTTPLSTARIVWAKWWSTFRIVPLLSLSPVLITLAAGASSRDGVGTKIMIVPTFYLIILVGIGLSIAWHAAPRWRRSIRLGLALGGSAVLVMLVSILAGGPETEIWSTFLMGLMIFAYGAGLTSLGLMIATWTPRLDHAAALSVASYLVIAIVWPTVTSLNSDSWSQQLVWLSPPLGVGQLASVAQYHYYGDSPSTAFLPIVLFGLGSAVLLGLTLLSFNHCLGRIDDPLRRLGSRDVPRVRSAAA